MLLGPRGEKLLKIDTKFKDRDLQKALKFEIVFGIELRFLVIFPAVISNSRLLLLCFFFSRPRPSCERMLH